MQNQNVKKHLQIIFQDASKIILQLRSSKIGQDFLPIRRVLQMDCPNRKIINTHKEEINETKPQRITLKRPKFGFNFPARTLKAADFRCHWFQPDQELAQALELVT